MRLSRFELPIPTRSPFCDPDQDDRGDDCNDEAENVQFEDVACPERVRDETADHGTGQPEQQRHHDAEALLPRSKESRERTDNETGNDETDHGFLRRREPMVVT